ERRVRGGGQARQQQHQPPQIGQPQQVKNRRDDPTSPWPGRRRLVPGRGCREGRCHWTGAVTIFQALSSLTKVHFCEPTSLPSLAWRMRTVAVAEFPSITGRPVTW